jgi:hypothetical protein
VRRPDERRDDGERGAQETKRGEEVHFIGSS